MDFVQFSVFLVTMIWMNYWYRVEATKERREMMSLIKAIQEEIKDFHGRLCAIEERNRK